MNFIKMGRHEINICLWELINKKEDEHTWACFKRLQRKNTEIVSLYKRTCKLNSLTVEDEIIQKINSNLGTIDILGVKEQEAKKQIMEVEDKKLREIIDQPKMISRKKGN